MIIIVEVHENPSIGCDAKEFMDNKFNDSVFVNNGHEIIVKPIEKATRDMLVVVTPNGDRREIYAYDLNKLMTTLLNLTGTTVIGYD